jgi:glycosyltransferase involved in cell wall biosynthesis
MWPGGTENQLAGLIKRLDRSQFEPALCVFKPGGMDLHALGCPVLTLSFSSFRAASCVGCFARLRRFIQQHQVDILHTFFADPSVLGYFASLKSSVRVRVGSIRDLGFWRTPHQRLMLRTVYPFFDGFISNSKIGASAAHVMDRIALDKIEIIPNGLDLPLLEQQPGEQVEPVVGLVSNLNEPIKRVDLFLEAAHLVHRARPEARFVIVGDGPMRGSLEAQAASLGIRERVNFVGSVLDAPNWVKSFAVGVSSSDSEGLSNAIMEFMAAGVPTVARNVGGNAELVVDGETGVLVDSDRPAAIAEAILRLLREPSTRRCMGARARRAATANYSWERCIGRHQEYYARLLSAKRGQRMIRRFLGLAGGVELLLPPITTG